MLIQDNISSIQTSRATSFAGNNAPVADIVQMPQTIAQTPVPQTPAQPAPTPSQLQNAVQNANQAMLSKGLEFSVDTDTKQTVVRLLDTTNGTVIGQFPSQQMIDISKAIALIQEQLQQASLSKAPVQTAPGMLIKQQA